MRKLLMVVTMLLVPALANAWVLAVKVTNTSAGIAAGNKATVSVGGVLPGTNVTAGTSYFYPTNTPLQSVQVVVANPADATVTLGGVAATPDALTTDTYTIAANAGKTLQTLAVVYGTTATAVKQNINLSSTAGGVSAIKIGAALSSSGFTNVTPGTVFDVVAQPNTGYKVTSITVEGIEKLAAASTAKTTVSAVAVSGQATDVVVTYAVDPQVTLVLAAPPSAVSGTTISAVAQASSNVAGVTYKFATTCQSGVDQAAFQSSNVFSFKPDGASASCTVSVQATVAGLAVPASQSMTIAVANGQVAANQTCTACHAGTTPTIVNNYNASAHATNSHSTCASCHTTNAHVQGINSRNISKTTFTVLSSAIAADGTHPAVAKGGIFCTKCHNGAYAIPHPTNLNAGITCSKCHTDATGHNGGTGDAHAVKGLPKCIECHSVAQAQVAPGLVNDNNGVRSITQEFTKWSHHVTGVDLQDAHCAACHLEGKVVNGEIEVDSTKHMVDGIVHLRHADTDADMQWNPETPNHSTMDTFCMSCHDANGATSAASQAIQAVVVPAAGKTASNKNPFGDTISNRYDKMQRPGVVDVDSQFATGNPSHHAVKGNKYSGRTRAAGPRQIVSPSTFANNSSATLYGVRSTIYDALTTDGREAFNALYVPLENASGEAAPRTGAAELGDDSTLHCGDCHTVGQWKPGTAKSFNPTNPTTEVAGFVSPAIGAHGSNNEYLLRNSRGTDERHTQEAYTVAGGAVTLQNPNAAYLVCFNCHSYSRYGSVFNATGATGPHAGEYDAGGRCNGVGNTIPFNGYTTGTATDGTQFGSRLGENMVTITGPTVINGKTYTSSTYPATVNTALASNASTPAFAPGFPLNFAKAPGGVQAQTYNGEQEADFGNAFGIQCLNCHNSGVENGYGGIHGAKVGTYIDGMGNTQTMRRFLPGLGNTKYVPGTLGGISGGTVAGPVTNTRNSTGNQVYTYTTGGVSNDANWEQKESKRRADGAAEFAGAGCYTLGESSTAATFEQEGLSVDGGATTPHAFGTWGACDDHGADQGAGDHGTFKRINRPVTY